MTKSAPAKRKGLYLRTHSDSASVVYFDYEDTKVALLLHADGTTSLHTVNAKTAQPNAKAFGKGRWADVDPSTEPRKRPNPETGELEEVDPPSIQGHCKSSRGGTVQFSGYYATDEVRGDDYTIMYIHVLKGGFLAGRPKPSK